MVPAVLWASKITKKEATRESPFKLAFPSKVVFPIEVGFPSYWIKHQNLENNDQALRENLNTFP